MSPSVREFMVQRAACAAKIGATTHKFPDLRTVHSGTLAVKAIQLAGEAICFVAESIRIYLII